MESISVIIPAYKAAKTIGRAIGSVLVQSTRASQIIVVDDGSPDDITAAVQPFDSQVTLIRKPNGGAASARNLGIEHAKGNWIAFLDADDYWDPSKLEKQLAIAAGDPTIGLLASWWFDQKPGGAPALDDEWDPTYFGRTIMVRGPEAFRAATWMSTPTVVVRRDVLGGHRFDCSLGTGEDRDMWVRLLSETRAHLLKEPLVTVVHEPGSLSRSGIEQDCRNMLRVIDRHAELLGPAGVRSQEATVYARWAGNSLIQGNPRAAMRPAIQRLWRQPISPQGWWVLAKSAMRACASTARPLAPAAAKVQADDQCPGPFHVT